MSTRPLFIGLLSCLVGCLETPEQACDSVCNELVVYCETDAYPSLASCRQGCEHSWDQGADVDREAACIAESECNLFDILECEHAYGPLD